MSPESFLNVVGGSGLECGGWLEFADVEWLPSWFGFWVRVFQLFRAQGARSRTGFVWCGMQGGAPRLCSEGCFSIEASFNFVAGSQGS